MYFEISEREFVLSNMNIAQMLIDIMQLLPTDLQDALCALRYLCS